MLMCEAKKTIIGKYLIPALAVLCAMPFINAGAALALGITAALLVGNPYMVTTRKLTKTTLSLSVIGLGAGMNLINVAQAGLSGIGYTAISIVLVLALGMGIAKLLKTEKVAGMLISVGTAICGGSAIAAIAPVIDAKPHQISVSVAVVFILNAVALLIFPMIGHALDLTQEQFGLWSALAIHDTSSVVGASAQYGARALEVGTTVKLARALWIVPLVFAVQAWHHRQIKQTAGEDAQTSAKPKYPWFILGFLAMAAVVTYVPALQGAGHIVELCARRLLVVTLFLIGANLTIDTIKEVGPRPLLQGVLLWVIVLIATLAAIKTNLIVL